MRDTEAMTQRAERNRFVDQPDSFGWLSIALHWVTAAIIVALWIIGRSIVIQDSTEAIDARRSVHIMIALSAWLLLLLRIVWRLRMHHPHAAGQSLFIHRAAQSVHYIMLVVLSLMMVSGPVMAWVSNETITNLAYRIHASSADVLLALVLLHVAGALKHMMFHEDDTIIRMLWPRRRP